MNLAFVTVMFPLWKNIDSFAACADGCNAGAVRNFGATDGAGFGAIGAGISFVK
jgi:hypothetical protein